MATRSVIAKLDETGVEAIYCHNDGYLSNNGILLDQHYADEDNVDELLAEGDISSLRDTIADTTFYMRDRGESNKEATTLKDESALLEFAFESCDAEVVYMYAYGAWYVYDNKSAIGDCSYKFVELDDVLSYVYKD